MLEVVLLGFCAAFGFAASGTVSSLWQWVTKRPIAFALPSGSTRSYVIAVVGYAFTGPYIVAKAAFRARFVDGRSWGMMGVGLSISLMWSICSGVIVIYLMLQVGALG